MNEPNQGRKRLPNPAALTPEATDAIRAAERDARAPERESTRVDSVGRRTLKVTWGEENYHPVAYNGFKCGGLELVVDVAPNQTIEEAYDLAYGRLQKIAERQFEGKLEGFISRLRSAGQAVKVSAASKS